MDSSTFDSLNDRPSKLSAQPRCTIASKSKVGIEKGQHVLVSLVDLTGTKALGELRVGIHGWKIQTCFHTLPISRVCWYLPPLDFMLVERLEETLFVVVDKEWVRNFERTDRNSNAFEFDFGERRLMRGVQEPEDTV